MRETKSTSSPVRDPKRSSLTFDMDPQHAILPIVDWRGQRGRGCARCHREGWGRLNCCINRLANVPANTGISHVDVDANPPFFISPKARTAMRTDSSSSSAMVWVWYGSGQESRPSTSRSTIARSPDHSLTREIASTIRI